MSNSLYILPVEIYRQIQSYTNINALLNSSKQFKRDKYEVYYWKLNKEYSLKYYNDMDFRGTINNLVYKTKYQLSLDLSRCEHLTDISMLGNVHTLNLHDCVQITDVSMLRNVHTLNLS